MSRLSRVATVLGSAPLLIVPLLLAAPASAATTTNLDFVGETALTVPFGADWSFAVEATSVEFAGWEGETTRVAALGPTSGSITVAVSGIGGTFSSGIPVQVDGRAYITQPAQQPLLAAGEYTITAIFVPAAGSRFSTSQTPTVATLTIEALAMNAEAKVISDPSVSQLPYIEATLYGDYVTAFGGTPPGTWSFTLNDGSTQVAAFETPQQQQAPGPVRVAIDAELRAGRTFTLVTVFTPSVDVIGGIKLEQAADAPYESPGGGILDAVTARVPFPLWSTFVVGGALLGLASVVIVLAVKLSRRNTPESTARSEDPVNDVVIANDEDFDQVFGVAPDSELSGDHTDSNWSLSEDELANDEPEVSNAPDEGNVSEPPQDDSVVAPAPPVKKRRFSGRAKTEAEAGPASNVDEPELAPQSE